MEIYMLTKHGVKASKATTIVVENFIFYQLALVIFGLIAILYNYIFKVFPEVPFLKELVILGFIAHTVVTIGLFLITISKKFTNFCLRAAIKLLTFFKVIKDKKEATIKWQERLAEFHSCSKDLKKRKKLFFGGIFVNILGLGCLYIIPLFIVYGLHDFTSINAAQTLTACAYVFIVVSFVPIPGASGGIEYGFMQFYGNFIGGSTITTTLLIWRFITYYFGMILGAIVFNFHDRSDKLCE